VEVDDDVNRGRLLHPVPFQDEIRRCADVAAEHREFLHRELSRLHDATRWYRVELVVSLIHGFVVALRLVLRLDLVELVILCRGNRLHLVELVILVRILRLDFRGRVELVEPFRLILRFDLVELVILCRGDRLHLVQLVVLAGVLRLHLTEAIDLFEPLRFVFGLDLGSSFVVLARVLWLHLAEPIELIQPFRLVLRLGLIQLVVLAGNLGLHLIGRTGFRGDTGAFAARALRREDILTQRPFLSGVCGRLRQRRKDG